MVLACAAPPTDLGFVQSLLGTVDCNVQALSAAAYASVAEVNSPVSAALTALLTLYIGFMGFRILIGRAPLRIGELTVAALKIGVVLALATHWPTYQQLVFDTLFRGPEQLATSMLDALRPGEVLGVSNPFEGLQIAYDQMLASADWYNRRSVTSVSPLQGGPAGAAFALNISALLMLVTTLGVVLAAKIALGLLLGLGPVFVALLLFDATRGVFEGWLRAAIAFSLTPLLATLALVVQLALIGAPLTRLIEMRGQVEVDTTPATAVLLLTLVCAVVTAALVLAGAMIATGVRLGRFTSATRPVATATAGGDAAAVDARPTPRVETRGLEAPARASVIAAAAAAMDRRDTRRGLETDAGPRRLAVATRPTETGAPPPGLPPLGQTYRRRAQPGPAASRIRRDR